MSPPDDPEKPEPGEQPETAAGQGPNQGQPAIEDEEQAADEEQPGPGEAEDEVVDLEKEPAPDTPTTAKPAKPVDLEDAGAGAPASPPIVNASLPEPISQKPENSTDRARKKIAYWLLAILTGIVVASFVLLFWALGSGEDTTENNYKHISGWLNIIYGPVVTLVGSAVGFYFGAQSNQPEDPNPS